MQPTRLYIKQHNITGLKYLGKTQMDVDSYTGQGMYWKRHLKKHGLDISTIWVQEEFTQKEEISEFALFLSEFLGVTENKKIWANIRPENGLDGNMKGVKLGPNTEERKRNKKKPKQESHRNNMRKPKQESHRNNMSKQKIGKKRADMTGSNNIHAKKYLLIDQYGTQYHVHGNYHSFLKEHSLSHYIFEQMDNPEYKPKRHNITHEWKRIKV